MTHLVLVWAAVLAGQDIVDSFCYRDSAAAQAAWTAVEKTPAVELRPGEGQPSLFTLMAPFASQSSLSRAVIDRSQKLDLRRASSFAIEIRADSPDALGQVSLYFRSGPGWYVASRRLTAPGWQTLDFAKISFTSEGKPAGWEHVDRVRLCVWRPTAGTPRDALLQFRQLAAVWNDVAVLWPAERDRQSADVRPRLENCRRAEAAFRCLGVNVDRINEADLADGLRDRQIVVFATPLNMQTVALLQPFVAGGGKIVAFDELPEELAKTLELDRTFATDRDLKISQNGALLRLPRDVESRDARELLATALFELEPALAETIVNAAIERVGQIGHCTNVPELSDYLKQNQLAGDASDDGGATAWQAALQARAKHNFQTAFKLAEVSHAIFVAEYLRAVPRPVGETLAVWNHSGLGAYPGDWDRSASVLSQNGVAAVFPNMLWGGVAHYASDVLPRSATFQQYGDQLEQCCVAAAEFGLQVHVWKVHFNLTTAPREFVQKMRREGRTQVNVAGGAIDWLCPSNRANRELEIASMVEVAKKYPIAGLHLDYIRYPGRDACYCDGCRHVFEEQTRRPVANWPADCSTGERRREYNEWRCQQITSLVAKISREVRRTRPGIKISAAVFGAYPDCRETVAQDWPQWVRQGYLDFVCPMNYTSSKEEFVSLVTKQQKLIDGRVPLWPGIGATSGRSSLSADQVLGQMVLGRQHGTAGFVIFDFSPTTAETILPAIGMRGGIQRHPGKP